jgi:hypothetical protein
MTIPPIPATRNHRQLAAWVNLKKLFSDDGRPVTAVVTQGWSSTDRKLAGTRLRVAGKGRSGLRLTLYVPRSKRARDGQMILYQHDMSETYRQHSEARHWIENNLRDEKHLRKRAQRK